eukprot:14963396-Alexandrium_andersonii.AAC.1
MPQALAGSALPAVSESSGQRPCSASPASNGLLSSRRGRPPGPPWNSPTTAKGSTSPSSSSVTARSCSTPPNRSMPRRR